VVFKLAFINPNSVSSFSLQSTRLIRKMGYNAPIVALTALECCFRAAAPNVVEILCLKAGTGLRLSVVPVGSGA
jgi:hypothetical protein